MLYNIAATVIPGGNAPVDPNNYQQGANVTVLSNTGNLVKAGYSFSGWNTAANGSGTSYSGGASFIIGTSSITLYAQWNFIPVYSVTYSGNGSTGGTVPVDTNSYTNGQTVTVIGNTGSLTLAYSNFTSWNTAANGSGTTYTSGQQLTMVSGGITLYAIWSALPLYNVTYSANGAPGGSVPVDGTGYTNGQLVTVLGNTGSLTKSGFAFTGWNTQAGGTGTPYLPGATFNIGAGSVILYAIWAPTYTVTYIGNGNNGGNTPNDPNGYTNGQLVTVLGNTGNLTKTGFTWTGWNTQAGGGGTTYSQGSTFTMGTGMILYALWSSNPTYTVTYNAPGSTGGNVPVDSGNYQSGQQVTVLGNTGGLVKTGFILSAWSNTTGSVYGFGQTFSMGSANVNLYAVWSPTYTVSYNGNGFTGGSVPVDGNAYTNGQLVTVLGNTGNLTRTGFIFANWNTVSTGGGASYNAGGTFTIGASSVTLYAQWTATYTVTYSGNGNSGGNVPVDGNAYTNGQLVTVQANSGSLTKAGYIYLGWNTAASGLGTTYTAGQTFNIVGSSVTLYALWLQTYNVTYNANGATGGTVPTDGNAYTNGQLVIVLSNTGALLKSGSTFTGWTNAQGTFYAPGAAFNMSGGANNTLYADWTLIPTYSVTYNGNGATGGNPPVDGNAYTNGQVVTVLGNTGGLTETGFGFSKWNTAANGSGTSYTNGQTFIMGPANVNLYAQWTASLYTVTYNGNGSSSGSVPLDGNSYTNGQTVTVLGNTGNLLKTGYTFSGWSTNAGGLGTIWSGGGTFTMGLANFNLYAYWVPLSYTVTYNSEGGTAEPSTNVIYPMTNVGALPTPPTYYGYTFSGWWTGVGGTGTQFLATTIVNANITVYAYWIPVTYTVTFNSEGGSAVPATNVTYEGTVSQLINPSLNGSTFSGWYTGVGGTGIQFTTAIPIVSNITVYADWTSGYIVLQTNGIVPPISTLNWQAWYDSTETESGTVPAGCTGSAEVAFSATAACGGFAFYANQASTNMAAFTNGHMHFEILCDTAFQAVMVTNNGTTNGVITPSANCLVTVANGTFGFVQSTTTFSTVTIPVTNFITHALDMTNLTYPFAIINYVGAAQNVYIANIYLTTN